MKLNLKKIYKGKYELKIDTVLITVEQNPFNKTWEGSIKEQKESLLDYTTNKMVEMFDNVEGFDTYYGETKQECEYAIISYINSLQMKDWKDILYEKTKDEPLAEIFTE